MIIGTTTTTITTTTTTSGYICVTLCTFYLFYTISVQSEPSTSRKWSKSRQDDIFRPGVNKKVVDDGLFHLHTGFQPTRDKNYRENGQKPSKMAKNGL